MNNVDITVQWRLHFFPNVYYWCEHPHSWFSCITINIFNRLNQIVHFQSIFAGRDFFTFFTLESKFLDVNIKSVSHLVASMETLYLKPKTNLYNICVRQESIKWCFACGRGFFGRISKNKIWFTKCSECEKVLMIKNKFKSTL